MTTECQCPLAGYCPTMKRDMTPRLHQLCKTSIPHRNAFLKFANREPGKPTRLETVETEPVGSPRTKGCGGCRKRRDRLNKIVPRLGDAVEAVTTVTGIKYVVDKIADRRHAKEDSSQQNPYLTWSYGITTVPERLHELLPKTIDSLAKAGFDRPRLFVDGTDNPEPYKRFGLPVVLRPERIRTYGNWILALMELYLRDTNADRYAVFQDDFVAYRNLKEYLNRSPYPENGYLNLYTFPSNQRLAKDRYGWYESNQLGKGAVALVFNRDAVVQLLSSHYLAVRPQDAKRGHKAIDGGIVEAFRAVGWKEYVHNPSLVQHTGMVSSMGNRQHPLSESFRGESYDALELLGVP